MKKRIVIIVSAAVLVGLIFQISTIYFARKRSKEILDEFHRLNNELIQLNDSFQKRDTTSFRMIDSLRKELEK